MWFAVVLESAVVNKQIVKRSLTAPPPGGRAGGSLWQ